MSVDQKGELMSLLNVVPDAVSAASGDLQNLGSVLRNANAAAAAQTTSIAAPAADEVSAAVTALFGTHAQNFQALNAKAAAFHDQFVNLLGGGAAQYVNAELQNAEQTLASAVNAPAQALLRHLLTASGTSAAANPASSETTSSNQTISTPFGPVTLTVTQTVPSDGNGPVGTMLNATTPLGNAQFSFNGTMSTPMTLPVTSTVQFTGGTLVVPPALPLLLGAAGPYVTGGTSLVNSANSFMTAVHSGNLLGAAGALISAQPDFYQAVLFGQDTITVPLGTLDGSGTGAGPTLDWSFPFGGLFAPAHPISVSWPSYSAYDPSTSSTANLVGGSIAFQGTQFGGLVPELLGLVGIHI